MPAGARNTTESESESTYTDSPDGVALPKRRSTDVPSSSRAARLTGEDSGSRPNVRELSGRGTSRPRSVRPSPRSSASTNSSLSLQRPSERRLEVNTSSPIRISTFRKRSVPTFGIRASASGPPSPGSPRKRRRRRTASTTASPARWRPLTGAARPRRGNPDRRRPGGVPARGPRPAGRTAPWTSRGAGPPAGERPSGPPRPPGGASRPLPGRAGGSRTAPDSRWWRNPSPPTTTSAGPLRSRPARTRGKGPRVSDSRASGPERARTTRSKGPRSAAGLTERATGKNVGTMPERVSGSVIGCRGA